jgi:hypothetical protein
MFNGDLMIGPYVIDLREDGTDGQLECVVVLMPDGVAVRDDTGV